MSLCLSPATFPKCLCCSLSYLARPTTTSLAVSQFVATIHEHYAKIISTGLFLALDVYRSKFSATSPYIVGTYRDNEKFLWVSAGIWAVRTLSTFPFFLHSPWTQFAEISNLHTHLTLRNLRPANTRKRAIPYGYGFSLVSCPNYFFEAVAWGVICVMTGSVAGTSFAACSLCSPPPPTLGSCSLRCSFPAPFLHFRFGSEKIH